MTDFAALSVTVSEIVKVPFVKDCETGFPVLLVPPRFQLYVYGLVPPVTVAVKVIVCPDIGTDGLGTKLAKSAPGGDTVTDCDAGEWVKAVSVALRETVKVPDALYV